MCALADADAATAVVVARIVCHRGDIPKIYIAGVSADDAFVQHTHCSLTATEPETINVATPYPIEADR